MTARWHWVGLSNWQILVRIQRRHSTIADWQKNCNFFLQHLIPFWRQFLSKKRSQYWSKFSWPTAAWKLIFPRKSNLLFCNWKEKWKWPLRFFRNQVKMSRNKTLKAYLLFPEWLFKLVALILMILRKKTSELSSRQRIRRWPRIKRL